VSVEVKVPHLAESITDATLVEWLRGDGEVVRTDEPIATLETDKAAVEIAATEDGRLHHARQVGEIVKVDDVLARIETGGAVAAPGGAAGRKAAAAAPRPPGPVPASAPDRAAAAPTPAAAAAPPAPRAPRTEVASSGEVAIALSPAVRRLVEEHGIDPARIPGTGPGGRLLKEDVLRHVPAAPPVAGPAAEPAAPPVAEPAASSAAGAGERLVPMNRVRQRIAERLVQAQHTAAILTTFNEVDMSAVMALRARWREGFEKKHGVRLGLMSFFARASILALQEVPEVNAEIRGTDIVYHDVVHLAVAVQTDRGLVVPVIHDAHRLSFAEIEREIARLAGKSREHRLSLDDLAGGTFTVSNGGVYGSLLSTPILNPPQSGILGMHKIEKRPVAVGDQVLVRPMMYVALSYDHRLVDGEQSVTFLVKVKERLEDPERMLIDV
jgi:2-oxoglutarate dehydrogenase E2 component (dihydrolipoamide succinyltransferase)